MKPTVIFRVTTFKPKFVFPIYFLFLFFISFVKGICARNNHVIQALLATTQTKIPSLDVGRVLKDIGVMEFNAYLLPANKDPLPAFRY